MGLCLSLLLALILMDQLECKGTSLTQSLTHQLVPFTSLFISLLPSLSSLSSPSFPPSLPLSFSPYLPPSLSPSLLLSVLLSLPLSPFLPLSSLGQLQVGDRILTINEDHMEGASLQQAVKLVQEAGDYITMEVEFDVSGEQKIYTCCYFFTNLHCNFQILFDSHINFNLIYKNLYFFLSHRCGESHCWSV